MATTQWNSRSFAVILGWLILLHWLPIRLRMFTLGLCTVKHYINQPLQPYVTSRTFRSSDQGSLSIPKFRQKTEGDICNHSRIHCPPVYDLRSQWTHSKSSLRLIFLSSIRVTFHSILLVILFCWF